MKEEELQKIIKNCVKGDPTYQRQLFSLMYKYGMSVAYRHAQTTYEAEEIANEGFFKMLHHIDKYNPQTPFKLWLRRIIINCGIDHYRKYKKKKKPPHIPQKINTNAGESKVDSEYLIAMIRQLTPQYRMVFVLHVIEGFSHKEIAKRLQISIGTSKSNLSKARKKLKEMILIHNQQTSRYGR